MQPVNKATEGMTRSIMSSLETRCEARVPSGQPVVQENDRHTVWLWKRFQPGEDGLSRYYRQYQRWNFRSKWGHGVWLKRSMAVDSHVTGTCLVVRSVRRMMSRSRHENPVFLSVRHTPARLAMWKHHRQQWKHKRIRNMWRPCSKRAKQHHQEQRHERHQTSHIGSSGGERKREAQPHTFG